MNVAEIRTERQRLAVPVLKGLEVWMQTGPNDMQPQRASCRCHKVCFVSMAARYAVHQEGHYYIDSNQVEQGQRPSVLGRKNYLFSQNDRGAEDSAIFYMVSCENLGVNAYRWLEDTLQHIRPDIEEEQLVKLLPCN